MDIYSLNRNFWNFCFDNPEKISPNHCAIYFFAIEHCNRLGWKEKFGFPTQMAMDAIGIKKHQTYIRYFNDLCEWGFFDLIEKSQNQYSANIIRLVFAMPKNGKALDKAIINHAAKQTETMRQSNSSIDKQVYQSTNLPTYNQQDGELAESGTSLNLSVIPELDTFLTYGLQQAESIGRDRETMVYPIRCKYESWIENGWTIQIDGKPDRPIKNWKSTLRNTVPHLEPVSPKIEKPKIQNPLRNAFI